MGPMTTRSNRPVPAAVVWGTSGGAGTTGLAVPLAALTQPTPRGYRVLVGLDSRVFDVLDRPPCELPGLAVARRSPVGADCRGS